MHRIIEFINQGLRSWCYRTHPSPCHGRSLIFQSAGLLEKKTLNTTEGLPPTLVSTRRILIVKVYRIIMDSRHNPLSHVPDTNTRHLVMQILARIWCIVFSLWMGSISAFGLSAAIHAILLAGIFATVGVFEAARRQPAYFGGLGRSNGGEHE